MRNSSVNKFLAAAVASGLVIASCGGSDDASDSGIGGEEAPAEIDGEADVGTRNDDAEDFLIDEPSEQDTEEEGEAPAATDAASDETASAQDEFAADAEDRLAEDPPGSGGGFRRRRRRGSVRTSAGRCRSARI